MKCKFYSEEIDRCLFDGLPDVCPFEENCEGFYKLCEGCNVLPTRQEAIERMAKAICASNMAPDCLWECETCDRWKGSDKEAAEAALNALLEEHK